MQGFLVGFECGPTVNLIGQHVLDDNASRLDNSVTKLGWVGRLRKHKGHEFYETDGFVKFVCKAAYGLTTFCR